MKIAANHFAEVGKMVQYPITDHIADIGNMIVRP